MARETSDGAGWRAAGWVRAAAAPYAVRLQYGAVLPSIGRSGRGAVGMGARPLAVPCCAVCLQWRAAAVLTGVSSLGRTKWKRQTAVGMELLAEAGNVAALQRIYGGSGVPWPYPAVAGLPPQSLPAVPPPLSAAYYSQLAAVQKPLAYRVFPPGLGLAAAAAVSAPPSSLAAPPAALSASAALASYYSRPPSTSRV